MTETLDAAMVLPHRPCTADEMADPLFRLGVLTGTSIYTIKSKDASGEFAGSIPFCPREDQIEIVRAFHEYGWEFLIFIKARQVGGSLVIELIILDAMLFGSGVNCCIVDKTEQDAFDKMEDKIRFGYQSLPEEMRSMWIAKPDNKGEFGLRLRGTEEQALSKCSAKISGRGTNIHILHISEWGEVQQKDPLRSKEILLGALPTADHPGCKTIIETTWKGGKYGDIWPYIVAAQSIPESEKGPKDPRIIFAGWHTNPDNTDAGPPAQITRTTHDYCDKAERIINKRLDNGQRLWWQKKKEKFGIFMGSEHPTYLEECFEAPTEGAFFDAEGMRYQTNEAVGLQPRWQMGDIVLNGPPGQESAQWVRKTDERQCPFVMLEGPQDSESYLIAVDFCGMRMAQGATGKRDCHAAAVWRAGKVDPRTERYRPPQIVCSIRPEDRSNTDEIIRRILCMHRLYGDCKVAPENNNKDNVCGQMQKAGINNIWGDSEGGGGDGMRVAPGQGKTQTVLGWNTNAGTRKQILDGLQTAVREQDFIAGLTWVAREFTVFIVVFPKDGGQGRPEAAGGENDDWVMMCAIGLFCMQSATPYVAKKHQAAAATRWNPSDWQEEVGV